jgi:hypothetical protein
LHGLCCHGARALWLAGLRRGCWGAAHKGVVLAAESGLKLRGALRVVVGARAQQNARNILWRREFAERAHLRGASPAFGACLVQQQHAAVKLHYNQRAAAAHGVACEHF